MREEQAGEMRSFIDAQNIPASDPVIITGDYNIDFHSQVSLSLCSSKIVQIRMYYYFTDQFLDILMSFIMIGSILYRNSISRFPKNFIKSFKVSMLICGQN